MDPKFQTSFIPKKPIVASASVSRSSVDFLMIIGIIIFLGSGVLAGGVYLYRASLQKNLVSLQDSLASASDQFDEKTIGAINRLNTRIETTKLLLKQHISASTIFSFLSEHTLKTVSYTDFTYSYESDGSIKVVLKGVADKYESIALQSEEFGQQNQYIKSPIFSDLNPDQNGHVVFTLTALIDKNLISYEKTFSATAVPESDTKVSSNNTGDNNTDINIPVDTSTNNPAPSADNATSTL